MSIATPTRRFSTASLGASALVLAVYAYGLWVMPTHVFWSPDEGGKLLQTKTIQFSNGFEYVLQYPGASMDPQLRFYAYQPAAGYRPFIYPARGSDGSVELYWSAAFSLLAKLPLSLWGVTGAYLVPLLAGWLTAVFSGRLAAEIDPLLEAPVIAVVGLATPVYFYSLSFWEHTAAALLGVVAVLVFVRGGGRFDALLRSTPFLVAAVALRIELIALAVVLLASSLICRWQRHRQAQSARAPSRLAIRVGLVTATAALVVLLMASLPERHLDKFTRLPAKLLRLDILPTALVDIFVNSSAGSGPQVRQEMRMLASAALVICMIVPFIRQRRLEALLTVSGLAALLSFSLMLAFMPPSYRCLHGLFPIAPFMIVAPYALPTLWRHAAAPPFVLGCVAVLYVGAGAAMIFANSVDSSTGFTQGLQWGQRYLLPLYPLLTVLSLAGASAYWRSSRPLAVRAAVAALAALLIVAGFLLERRGIAQANATRRMLATWQEALEETQPVVTDIWWLPAALAEYYSRAEVYVVDDRRELDEWSRVAAAHGVKSFTFASMTPIRRGDFRVPSVLLDYSSTRVIEDLFLTRMKTVGRPAGAPR
jgi:hypothetical protein